MAPIRLLGVFVKRIIVFVWLLVLSGWGGKGRLANGIEPRSISLSTKRNRAPNVFWAPENDMGALLLGPVYRSLSARLPQNSIRMAHEKPIRYQIKDMVRNG